MTQEQGASGARDRLRAADSDRQAVADKLMHALNEGRLSLGEYDERLQQAYAARTYGDLDGLLTDLPDVQPAADSQLARGGSSQMPVPHQPAGTDPAVDAAAAGLRRGRRSALAAVWAAWLSVVSINVVIWVLVSVSAGHPVYFWPMWIAGPWGAVLIARTVAGDRAGTWGPHDPRGRQGMAPGDRADRQHLGLPGDEFPEAGAVEARYGHGWEHRYRWERRARRQAERWERRARRHGDRWRSHRF